MIRWKPLVRGAAIAAAVFVAACLATACPCQAARRTWLDWLFGPPAQTEGGAADEPADRALEVVFAFYMTGDVSPESLGPTSSTCEQLLDMLLGEPGRKFSVGMSARLASALAWSGSRALGLMRDGVSRGQFELMGSTHSDAVLAAPDPWDARSCTTVPAHFRMFGSPDSWNPSGVWSRDRAAINAGAIRNDDRQQDSGCERIDGLPAHAPLACHGAVAKSWFSKRTPTSPVLWTRVQQVRPRLPLPILSEHTPRICGCSRVCGRCRQATRPVLARVRSPSHGH